MYVCMYLRIINQLIFNMKRKAMVGSAGEIFVLPFYGQGHLFPSMELCIHFSSRNYSPTLIIPSYLSSSIPDSLRHHPFVQIVEIVADKSELPPPEPAPGRGRGRGNGANQFQHQHQQLRRGIETLLADRSDDPDQTRPTCVVIDVMMSWSKEIFAKFGVPTISFFTSGACSAAMEYAVWKVQVDEMKPGDVRVLPGLPQDMALAYSDLERRPRGPFRHVGGGKGSLPGPPNGMNFDLHGSDGLNGLPNGMNFDPPKLDGLNGPPNEMNFDPLELDRLNGPPNGMNFGPPGSDRLNGPSNGINFDPHGSDGPPNGMNFEPLISDKRNEPPNGMNFVQSGSNRPHGPPARGMRFGPPGPGQKPRWLEEVEGSIALLINTCDELENPFINYVVTQIGKPVWGVGLLLPEKYWKSAGSLLHDGEIRSSGRKSNYTEDEVIQWLDSKPCGSVIYISFGSEIGPTVEEYEQLANALGESNQPFIWVLQPNSGKTGPPSTLFGVQTGPDAAEEGYYPHGLDKKTGHRGLIIRGWAPQLLILSHPSTGGFLSHCGWNSTVEAIGRGVPILAWPIRGDQYYNAKLVVSHLKVGFMVSSGGDSAKGMKKEDIIHGIERLMADEEVHKRAGILCGKLESGFPASSVAALDDLVNFIKQEAI